MTKEATKDRLRKIFIVASERVMREVYTADKMGVPSDEMIVASHEAAVDVFAAVIDTVKSPLSEKAIEEIAAMSDEYLTTRFMGAVRPQILEALASVRPS